MSEPEIIGPDTFYEQATRMALDQHNAALARIEDLERIERAAWAHAETCAWLADCLIASGSTRPAITDLTASADHG